MNLAKPAQSLDDNEARYLQDALLDHPGIIRRRGPVQGAANIATVADKIVALAQTLDPEGTLRIASLHGDDTHGYFSILSPTGTTYNADLAWGMNLGGGSNPYTYTDTKPGLTGGAWIGTSTDYDNTATQQLALWHGGTHADYSTGTVTVARGSSDLTGSGTSWTANVTPGMFLFANTDSAANDGGPFTSTYIGIVATVNSDTSITLGSPAPYPVTAKSYTLKSLRGFCPRVTTGYITCDTSGTTVTGAKTKFKQQGLATGTWNIYRASDMTWIGGVSSITNDGSLTLRANASVSMNVEAYVALRADGDFSLNNITTTNTKVGFLTAIYAERQWYANNGSNFDDTYRVWFSDETDPEAVDLSPTDGDFIPIGSTTGINTPIRALETAYNALVVLKENEAFAVYGNSPTQFQVKKIADDGTLSGMSVQPYQGGVIWAGKDGIQFYDGIQVTNLTVDKLGDYYKNALRTFDPTKYRMWSMVVRDHYFLHIENLQPSVAVVKGSVSSTPSSLTICVFLPNRAITMMTNLGIRGAIVLPQSSGVQVWYAVNSSSTGYICDTADLFDTYGNDVVTCVGQAVGPDFYMESKKYDFGDGLRKKLYKQLAMDYMSQGDALKLDTVIGLNDIGKTSTTEYPATVPTWDSLRLSLSTWTDLKNTYPTWTNVILAVFKPKRIKFLKRSQHLAFRIYQASSSVNRVELGPFQIGYKPQRPGRI